MSKDDTVHVWFTPCPFSSFTPNFGEQTFTQKTTYEKGNRGGIEPQEIFTNDLQCTVFGCPGGSLKWFTSRSVGQLNHYRLSLCICRPGR